MKINPINYYLLLGICVVFIGCNTRKTQERDADMRIKVIEQLINDNALNSAKIHIDSIHSLYPKLVSKRKIAASLLDTVVRRESLRTLAYCDSLLPIKQLQADSIRAYFRLEKDTVYQKYGNYIHKSQGLESNANRNYLKAYVDENADFYLVSNYTGSKINYTSVHVSVADLFAQTNIVELTSPACHAFTVDGTHWEVVTFKNELENGVAAFISQFEKSRIKVVLEGSKKQFYFLTTNDKKAISDTYNLWIIEKDLKQLRDEIKKTTTKIKKIESRNIIN